MSVIHRRNLLTAAASTAVASATCFGATGEQQATETVVAPNTDRRILLSCKLSMISKKVDGRQLSLAERLELARDAGFDGVDFDEAGSYAPEDARQAVDASRMFVHNAINHAHWQQRLTSSKAEERETALANLQHCMRVSHAAGGCGVLIVTGRGSDGSQEEIEARCRDQLEKALPFAAMLGQPILIENVWNKMFYDHEGSTDQSAERFVQFIDSIPSPWIGMYFDIGNHWKYGHPGEWIRQFSGRCVKLDVKGFSRAANKFTDIGEGDLPWDEVRTALRDIRFTGWATAEVAGGDLGRLQQVRQQMEEVFELPSRTP